MFSGIRLAIAIILCLNYVSCKSLNNFTAVNSSYGLSEASEEKAIENLLKFERRSREVLFGTLKSIFPLLNTVVSEKNISEECLQSVLAFTADVKNLKLWSVQMLDATAKPEGGILRGTMGHFGDYQQCLDVVGPLVGSTEKIKGKYCVLDLKLPLPPKPKHVRLFEPVFSTVNATFNSETFNFASSNLLFLNYFTTFKWAICVPSLCSNEDISNIIKKATSSLGIYGKLASCEIKETKEIDQLQISVMSVLGVVILANLIGTFYEMFAVTKTSTEISDQASVNQSILKKILLSFSTRRNFVQGFEIQLRKSAQNLDFIYGLRYLSMWWVFLIHTYVLVHKQLLKNIHNIDDHRKSVLFLMVENGYLAVETFLFVAAILLSYKALKDNQNSKPFKPFQAFICRVWRLLPSTILTIGIALIFPLFSSGPMWNFISEDIYNKCRKNWWANVLFVNNFLRFNEMCVFTTWYIPADVQCYILGIIYVVCYIAKPIVGNIFLGVIAAGSILSSGIMTFLYDYPPTNLHGNLIWTDPIVGINYMTRMYASTHVHISVYAIGLFTGTILATKKIHLNQTMVRFGWTLSTFIALVVLVVPYPWQTGIKYSLAESAMYVAFYRTGWAMSLAWISVACFTGKGGIANYLLSFSVYKPLGQITFMAYLLHYFVIYLYIGSTVLPMAYNHLVMVYYFFGLACISHIAGFIGHILVEAPFAHLGRIALDVWPLKEKVFSLTVLNSNNKKYQNGTTNHSKDSNGSTKM